MSRHPSAAGRAVAALLDLSDNVARRGARDGAQLLACLAHLVDDEGASLGCDVSVGADELRRLIDTTTGGTR